MRVSKKYHPLPFPIFSSHRRALGTALSQEGKGKGKEKEKEEDPAKLMFFAITWIRLIGFRQNLAWTYYLTLEISLRKNFSFA
jgi:hypothetical protein